MKRREHRNREKDHLARLNKQNRKEFFGNLKTICNLTAGYDLYAQLPSTFLERVYVTRARRIMLEMDDENITKDQMVELNQILHVVLPTYNALLPNGEKVPISIIMVEGISLAAVATSLKGNEFPAADATRETLRVLIERPFMETFNDTIYYLFLMLGMLRSNIRKGFIQIDYGLDNTGATKENYLIRYKLTVRWIKNETEQFTIDGNVRHAFRVGWALPTSDMVWIKLKVPELTNSPDNELPIYIQSHALNRFLERVELNEDALQGAIFETFLTINYNVNKSGRLLIDCILAEHKIGYFVASIQQEKILIHTFLFITNHGTPEGEKLSRLTGLQIMDKKYLAIDKMGTFLSYRIHEHEMVKNIFVEAGVGHLFDLNTHHQFAGIAQKNVKIETIIDYLQHVVALSPPPRRSTN